MYREYCYPYNGNAGREKIIIGGGLVQIGFRRLASFDSTHITSITFAVSSGLFFVFSNHLVSFRDHFKFAV